MVKPTAIKGMTEAMKRREMRERLQFRDRALIAALMSTGGRLQEVLMLNLHNFILSKDEEFIIVREMPLLKQYDREKVLVDVTREIPGEDGYKWDAQERVFKKFEYPTTSKIEVRQEFPIPLWEPISFVLTEYLDALDEHTPENHWGWLFPSPMRPYREEMPGVQRWIEERFMIPYRAWISPQIAHRIIVDLGKRLGIRIWGHWFRSQRARQLSRDYQFQDQHLERFIGWQSTSRSTAGEYTGPGLYDLMDLMRENKDRHEDYVNRDIKRAGGARRS